MHKAYTSNVFYTFGFLLLYIHFAINLVSVFSGQGYFRSEVGALEITILNRSAIHMNVQELVLLGGFLLFTIVGILLERVRLAFLKKDKESIAGWKYRNRIKLYYSIIAIILVIWATVQGYLYSDPRQFDWVWILGSVLILIYCVFLISFPRFSPKKKKSKT